MHALNNRRPMHYACVTLSSALLLTILATTSAGATDVAEVPYVYTRMLSLQTAQSVANEAARRCSVSGYQVAVAVVDRFGTLIVFVRDPLAGAHTVDVAIAKAYTAASFQIPTTTLTDERFAPLRHTPHTSFAGGGLPIKIGGYMYGAIGVSGAPSTRQAGDTDEACARAGVDAIREALELSP